MNELKIDVIVVPLIRGEINLLKTWLSYCPESGCIQSNIILSIDTSWTESEKKKLEEVFKRSALGKEGWKLFFHDCKMSDKESFYIKDSNIKVDLSVFPYGQKSGPNKQFFITMKHLLEVKVGSACLLMEVDAFPVKRDWLKNLNCVVGELPRGTMVAGGNYLGTSVMSPKIMGHLNGNSIYFFGNEGFLDFISYWEDLLLSSLKIAPHMAYDVVIPWFFGYREVHPGVKSIDIVGMDTLESVYYDSYVSLNKYLINLGGPDENHEEYKLNVFQMREKHPDALIFHGKCILKEIGKLRVLYDVDSRFSHHINILQDYISDGRLDDAFLSGFMSMDVVDFLSRSISRLDLRQKERLMSLGFKK